MGWLCITIIILIFILGIRTVKNKDGVQIEDRNIGSEVALFVGDIPIIQKRVTMWESSKAEHATRHDIDSDSLEFEHFQKGLEYGWLKANIEKSIIQRLCKDYKLNVSREEAVKVVQDTYHKAGLDWNVAQQRNLQRKQIHDALEEVHSGEMTKDEAYEKKLKGKGVSKAHWEVGVFNYLNKKVLPEPELYTYDDTTVLNAQKSF